MLFINLVLQKMASGLESCRQVFQIPGKRWWVLIAPNGKWGYEKEEQFIGFSSPQACMPRLPLLEHPYHQTKVLICQALSQTNEEKQSLSTLPFANLLHLALQWEGGQYWPQLAVGWLENGYPMSAEFVDPLKALQAKEWKRNNLHI